MEKDHQEIVGRSYQERVEAYTFKVAQITRRMVAKNPARYRGVDDWSKEDQEWRKSELKVLQKLRIAAKQDEKQHSANLSRAYLAADKQLEKADADEQQEAEREFNARVDTFEGKRPT